jgi:hypothetical protein
MTFERKLFREIFGTTKLKDGTWMIKTNEELDNLIEHKNIIHLSKVQRPRWLGHVERMPEEREVKKIYNWQLQPQGQLDVQRLG